ncbi:nose resistant to fluoxetine protein 6-like [Mizuhopecten yessoensis]|uniref:Nose resistant to fluoxetine protein 6 n=1 Tax=Mizuhopecten yessoensis TaxID=6573 RepID=A0A210Q1K2_MIZYE|nr:nose resistant to fluoxetine protein 6-like [Mizuhopecten yessoensis]OWF42585.1 Nose resistant to fluoxetine protein 6 [Mizuhopecten yessoensis]
MCVPDTCSGSDVYGLLKLDALESAKMMVRQADCMVESDITHDLAAFLTLILLGAFVVLVLCSTIFVFLENRSVFSDNKETVNLESASNNPVMKEFKIGDDNSVKTNEGIIPVQSLGCDKSVSHLTPQNGGEHQTDVSKDANSTGDGLPNLPHSVEQPRKMKYGVLSKIAKAFALQLNIPKIVSGKTGPNSIGCIHGIRFFTITWVMLCHTYVYLVMTFPNVWSLENPLNYIEMTHNFSFQIILGGTSAVDTFFMLSGMMLSYTQLKNLQTLKTKLTGRNVGGYVFHYFFHRLWRLTPIYMITILMFATVSEYMKSGPLMPTSFPYIENCKESWWTNLLYVNNLVMTDKPCGGWSWYLANDMQFYTVSLLILFMMIFKMPVAILTSLTLMAGGMAYTVYKQYHTKGSLISGASSFQEYWSNIYIAPWCRIAAFLVGLLFGIVMNKRPRKSFSKILNFAGWTTATAVALTLKYSLYDFNRKGGEPWTRWQNAFYEAFDRPVWALCVAWVIFSCHNHMGGPVNSILSWKGLVPLSRISYATYLVHYLIMATKNNTNYDVFHYTVYNMIYLFLGNTVFSFMAAFVTSLIFEAPFIALGKLIL